MEDSGTEYRLFVVLTCIGLLGALLRVSGAGENASSLWGLLAPTCSDILIFFGGIGSFGLLCTIIFGSAGVERTLFWVFVVSILGVVILYINRA